MIVNIGLAAEPGVTTTVGTFIETKTNNAHWAAANLTVVPGINLGIRGNETPLYGWFHFENRQQAVFSVNGYGGQELRHKYRFGSNLKLGSTSFNPEYELRIKNFVGYPTSLFSIFENRFKLNFAIPIHSKWNLYIELMPTLIININENRDDIGGELVFQDYYQEVEIGAGWSWNPDNTLLFSLYNELGIDERVRNSSGSINNGSSYYKYEFQFRLVYQHRFNNGIQLNPFARIGIVRNFLYKITPGVIESYNFRRDRIGVNLNYTTENGISPNLECYYQRSNMGLEPIEHRLAWTVGMDYTF